VRRIECPAGGRTGAADIELLSQGKISRGTLTESAATPTTARPRVQRKDNSVCMEGEAKLSSTGTGGHQT
jgi:hypothetical protein